MQPTPGKHAAKIEDDDIVAGPQKTSLKCPVSSFATHAAYGPERLAIQLSYARISTPCRSSHCVHVQCFDALSWYSVNEQTTTWSCPVCEKSINHEDLIVDGYSRYAIHLFAAEMMSAQVFQLHFGEYAGYG